MAIKVGINGFGRIGRIIFRTCLQNNDIELSAINDPAISAEYICYLIKFDSTHGKFNKSVSYANDEITVEDRIIKVFHEKLPTGVPWHTAGVQYVVEASGMFTSLDKASGHMRSEGVKRVIVTAPSVDVPMIILGVNDFALQPETKVVSCASSTLYCLAPIIKVLEDQFGITEGFVTSIHAMTPSLKPLDGLCLRGKHWRDHRSIHQNIIPATTGACKALGKIIPQVKDKMSGLAFRVPIVNVSVLDITIRLRSNTTLKDIVKIVEKASSTHMKYILKVSTDETVSSDYFGESHSCIFDSESSLQLKPNFYKLICWYENEHSYACRVIDSIFFSERQLSLGSISSKMTYVRTKPSKKYDVDQQTECLSKEISVECTRNPDLDSTSQDTGIKTKESHRNAILRKPLSAHISGTTSSSIGRETKRRNEIFKIWNDSNDIAKSCVRQNRGSFFHSCISFAPQDIQSSNLNGNERLENVKRDISKMNDMTDDLLKKTCNIKADADSAKCTVGNENISSSLNVTQEERTKEGSKNSYRKIPSIRTFDKCGDYETSVNVADSKVFDGSSKEVLIRTHNLYDKEIYDYSIITKKDSSKQETHKLFTQTKAQNVSETQEKIRQLNIEPLRMNVGEGESKILNNDNAFKEQVAKAVNNLIDGLEQSFHVSSQTDHSNSRRNGILEVKITPKKSGINEKTVDEKITKLDTNDGETQHLGKEREPMHITNDEIASKIKKENNNLKLATGIKYKMIHLNNKLYKREINCNTVIDNVKTKASDKDDKHIAKQILNGLNRAHPDPVVMIREDKIKPSSPDSTSSRKNFITNAPKQDIYDKLESVSETDSENSFEIHGRKSQVIHITDLTKSLEDLANLDKICRIIEISDELSDKLFSALNTTEGKDLTPKKWSFKDLCERIKLDEFCNKVFGKTTL